MEKVRKPAFNESLIKMESVTSSTIQAIGYDEPNQIMKIRFNNGGEYLYMNVEEFHFHNIMTNVKSVGKYFNYNIKDRADKYQCIKSGTAVPTSVLNEDIEEKKSADVDALIDNL